MERQFTLSDAVKDVFTNDPKSTLHFTEVKRRINTAYPGKWKMPDPYLQQTLNRLVGENFLSKPNGNSGKFRKSLARPEPQVVVPTRMTEMLRALDNAEQRPGYGFVSLKWFRDSVLPAVTPSFADPEARQSILLEGIEKRLLLTNKVPNPKNPSFPVTAVRINREHPEMAALLGPGRSGDSGFSPVEIRGEPLSETILRERR